jgi:lipopolysaccharide export system protein LptC
MAGTDPRPGFFATHHGYTTVVRRLRVVLPVVAVLLLAIVIIWPHFDPAQAPKRHQAAAPPAMSNSHFSGIDKKNRPYTVTADKAQQQASDRNDIDMENPLAELTMPKGWVALRGDHGQYREEPGLITLQGNVHLYDDQGYEMRSSEAAMDMNAGIAWSDKPTEGQGPRGTIHAAGFRMRDEDNSIVFTGPGTLVLHNDGVAVEGPPPDILAADAGTDHKTKKAGKKP